MRIAFYAPFKPLEHPNPSGDLVIATGLADYLTRQGHRVAAVSRLRGRWIYWKPWAWLSLIREQRRCLRHCRLGGADLWLTYHSYYKAPDLLGPWTCDRTGIPYVIFQGIYSTKRKRNWRTWPGFMLNRKALQAALHVFSNRREDVFNLKRLLPENRVTYVAPGIYPGDFRFDPKARKELRQAWRVEDEPVVLTAAMFRPGVKTEGLSLVIRACGKLREQGRRFRLVVAGDGKEKGALTALARRHLGAGVHFVGKIPREDMARYYSAADLFAFPGIRESLGMVYLEAQSCGLAVVAFADGGISEVVKNGETGLLVPKYSFESFVEAVDLLTTNQPLRQRMGAAARKYVRLNHDLDKNYRCVEIVLASVVQT